VRQGRRRPVARRYQLHRPRARRRPHRATGPLHAYSRGDLTELLPRSTRVRVAPATQTISVTMHATGQDSAYNTAYADNLSLTLRTFLNISGVGVVHKLG